MCSCLWLLNRKKSSLLQAGRSGQDGANCGNKLVRATSLPFHTVLPLESVSHPCLSTSTKYLNSRRQMVQMFLALCLPVAVLLDWFWSFEDVLPAKSDLLWMSSLHAVTKDRWIQKGSHHIIYIRWVREPFRLCAEAKVEASLEVLSSSVLLRCLLMSMSSRIGVDLDTHDATK